MRTLPFFSRLRNYFHPAISSYENEAAAVMERSLRETSDLFRNQLNTTNALRTELQYLYHIFLRRNKCSYKIHFINTPHFLLFTTHHDTKGTDMLVYLPREKAEIAGIYTHASGNALEIDDMVFNFRYCDTRFGRLLLGELAALAQSLCLERITGRFGRSDNTRFQELAGFLQHAGFHVTIAANQQTAEIAYEIKP